MDEFDLYKRLGLALAIGMLLGVERGWQLRQAPEGTRIAGIRSFSLMGLLGGLWGLLAEDGGAVTLAVGFAAFAALIIGAHLMHLRVVPADQGITTEIAELVTFCLGAAAARGYLAAAAAGGVVTLALLSLKESLHEFVERIRFVELKAAVNLLLISVVMLPVLPNRGFGPGQTLNPYKLWWIVVMIAAISFVGYVAIRAAGPRIGTLLTGFFGGLASSTALTASFSRLGRTSPELQNLLAAGVVVAGATMFLRILLIVGILNAKLLPALAAPMGAMALACAAGAIALWLDRRSAGAATAPPLTNPFELTTALKFGLFLGVIMVLSGLLQQWYGNRGIYGLAAVAGLADVDAISVSMARLAGRGTTTLAAAANAVAIAAFVNTTVKAGIVAFACGGTMAWRVAAVFALAVLAGLSSLWIGYPG